VEVPRLAESDAASVNRLIKAAGKLELRAVHPESATQAARVKSGEAIIPGYEYVEYRYEDWDTGEERTEDLLLSKRVEVSGKHVKLATPDAGQQGVLQIRLSKEGGDRMIRLTKNMMEGRDRIAVVLDDKIMSAPVVRSVPLGSNFIIEGLDSWEEANDLSKALMNPLSNSLEIVEVVQLSPGQPSPDKSAGAEHPPGNSPEN
jgi:SecD/SecF fusion protein